MRAQRSRVLSGVLGLAALACAGGAAAAVPVAAAETTAPADGKGRWQGADGPYLDQLHALVHPRWTDFLHELVRAPAEYQNGKLAVVLELSINADGSLAEVGRPESSGLAGYDDAPVDLIRELGRLPPPPPMVRADDDRVHVRWRFSRSEPGCEDRKVVDRRLPLEEALSRLVEARRNDEAIARFEEARRADPAVARKALPRLGAAMARAALSQPVPAERAAAAAVLAQLPDGEAALVQLAADPERSVRLVALEALGHPPRSPAARALLLSALDGDEREAAARGLGWLGDKAAVDPLATLLGKGLAPEDAAVALSKLGERARALAVIKNLLAGPPEGRLAGARASLALPDAHSIPALIAAFSGANVETRALLVDAIASFGKGLPPDAHKTLVRALHDTDPPVRARACAAIVSTGEKNAAARSRLVDALTDPAPAVRAAAAGALVPIAGAAAIDEITHAAYDKAPEIRAAVAAALVTHPFEGSEKILAHLAADPVARVHEAATPPPPAPPPLAPLEAVSRAVGTPARLLAIAAALAK